MERHMFSLKSSVLLGKVQVWNSEIILSMGFQCCVVMSYCIQ